MAKKKLAILLSGRGSNAKALIEACKQDAFPADIAVVISNKSDAPGLAFASKAGIPTHDVPHKDFGSDRNRHEEAICNILDKYDVDYICLAGYMRLLEDVLLERYGGRIINIHPSLLPAFKGLHTHERALKRGVKIHGCTVHLVTRGMDEGPILGQRAVRVELDDTPEILARRVLEQEHLLYPEIVQALAQGKQLIAHYGDHAHASDK